MTNKEQIQQEIERTLLSLDETKRAEANPFLFTRIMARMQRQNGWEKITSFISRPAIALSALIVVMGVNALVIFNPGTRETSQTESIAVSGITDEYNMTFATISDYENTEENELYQK
ncbi:MAG: hypothetical protein EPN92_03700 [Chitinophagaceae bacterium]|nr:MAG: hypothetical protein EPN92_03700 [Chitinophagaceae bacterium]